MKSKRIFIIFHGRFPGEKAAAIFTAKNAEAFAARGHDVVVLALRRVGRSKEEPRDFYGLKSDFKTVYLPIIDLFGIKFLKRFAFRKSYFTFSLSVLFYLMVFARRKDTVYSNESLPLLLPALIRKKVFYEVHDFPKNAFLNRLLFKMVKGAIITNKWKTEKLAEQFELDGRKLLYEPNGVDIETYDRAPDGAAVRSHLKLGDSHVIGYAGSLRTMEMEKGIEMLLKAVRKLESEKTQMKTKLLIVGGNSEDVAYYKTVAQDLDIEKEVIFAGFVPHQSVPEYLKACDVLIAPFPKTDHYEFYMSPMKIFEYMASGRPAVASRLRSIEEITGDSALLVEPDNVKELAKGIEKVLKDKYLADRLAQTAYSRVREHSWLKRADRILSFTEAGK